LQRRSFDVKIKKGDVVEVVTGDDVGKRGRVLQVIPKEKRAIVEGVNFVYKHRRPTREDPQGGRIQREAAVHVSNLRVVCNKCNRGVRTRTQAGEGKKRLRVCVRCGAQVGVD
jgi:large subunit ribosomal protein L24